MGSASPFGMGRFLFPGMLEEGNMIDSWHSYPKVHAMGHAAVKDLFRDEVTVEEKVDGSQFSFGRFISKEGAPYLRCKSKGCELTVEAPDNMFKAGVESAKELFPLLKEGWAYRAEYLAKPKHNTLAYSRVPKRHLILFDVNVGQESYLSYEEKAAEAERLGLEVVPIVHKGVVEDIEFFRSFLSRESVLGGQKVEGVVAKNYKRFSIDGKAMMGKFVSEVFKEVHGNDWKERNPGQGDIIARLIHKLRTPARWAKAVQHLKELGQLEGTPRDIGKLMPAACEDIQKECEAEVKQMLFDWAWADVRRGATSGLPEWYKGELLKAQFEKCEPENK